MTEPRIRPVDDLPSGTRVVRDHRPPGSRPRYGTVMHHDPQYSNGCFPVRWDDSGIWERCNATDVTVVETATVVTTLARRSTSRTARAV